MLTLNKAELGPSVAGLTIYRDDELDFGFYMMSEAPDVSRVDGAPQISLLIHGSRGGQGFRSDGGFFSCTTSLKIANETRLAAEEKLQRNLADQAGGETAIVRWLRPDWRGGHAELLLPTGTQLTSQPSLTGDNDCVFHGGLSAVEAGELDERWRRGDELSVSYDLIASVSGVQQGVNFAFHGRIVLSPEMHAACVRQIVVG